MKEIIEQLKKKINKDLNNINFYYKGNKINIEENLKLENINNEDNEIKLIVFISSKISNKYGKIKKSNNKFIICSRCFYEDRLKNNFLININEYKINFTFYY